MRSAIEDPVSCSGEDDLERPGLGGPGEHVVGVHELVESEVVGDETLGVDLVAASSRSRVGVE